MSHPRRLRQHFSVRAHLYFSSKSFLVVFKAIVDRWQNSPFDPFWFAEYRHLAITPRDDIPDARLIPKSSTGARIKFDPNQPKARVSFSLAREIGQTLFPDFGLTIRNRLKMSKRDSSDEA